VGDAYRWPAINPADSAISVDVMVILDAFLLAGRRVHQ
jgi:hypothetical protein